MTRTNSRHSDALILGPERPINPRQTKEQVIVFSFPYRGAGSISLNHMKLGGNMAWALTPEAASTREEIIWRAKNALQFTNWEPMAPLKVLVSGRFKNRRRGCDMANTHKLILDALQVALGVNDKDMAISSPVPFYGVAEPTITIEVRQGR